MPTASQVLNANLVGRFRLVQFPDASFSIFLLAQLNK